MKLTVNILFSVFFAIAIGVHVYELKVSNTQPFWWHCIYFLTYGVCWWMIFSKNIYRDKIYAFTALFPFITHIYYGYQHMHALDKEFWICLLVCVLLPLGFFWIKKATANDGFIK
jgi:hypothetical protein